jgi:hypothetical protein
MSGMVPEPHLVDPRRPDLAERNRRTARVLIAIMSALALATLLVGIRW